MPNATLNHDLLRAARAGHETMRQIRRALHRNPELSFQEFETSKQIQARLAELGIPFQVMANTGVVAHIGTGDRCVALRADIDALPIQEESGVEYSSTKQGVMHACGHDAHTAMLLGAAQILKERETSEGASSLGGVIKLIFQPGEEMSPGGASIMIREGVLQNPRPEAIFGQHVNPDATCGTAAFVSGMMLAATDELYWTIHGKSGHAAQPHNATDPILLAAHLITQLQTLVSRRLNPFAPGVLSICTVHGGHATNVIPDTVELSGTLRSMNQAWREEALRVIREHTELLGASPLFGGGRGELRIERGYPPLVNNAETTRFARQAAENLIGTALVEDFEPKMWGEDFAYYTQEIPGTFWMLGIRPPHLDFTPGLHNSKFILDENALPIGAALLANAALKRLAE
ncbi:MAG: M20 metallopeptidase family protein [Candidatus Kapaibacteriota bacterium]